MIGLRVSLQARHRWGRPLIFVGAALAASVWIARSMMQESPDFERQQIEGTVPRNPLAHAAVHHRAGIVRGFAISALGSITYYVGITYIPAFLVTTRTADEHAALSLSTIAGCVSSYSTHMTAPNQGSWPMA